MGPLVGGRHRFESDEVTRVERSFRVESSDVDANRLGI